MLKQTGIGLISASLLLAGCDNGSSGASNLTYDGPTAPVAIDATNADTVGGFASTQATSSAPGTSTTTGVTNASGGSEAQQANLSLITRMTKKFADLTLATNTAGTNILSGVATTQTTACSGGGTKTETATFNTNDPSTITSGDTASIVFNNCTETDPNTGITENKNGSGTVTYTAYSYTDANTFNYSASYIYDNLKITNISNGVYDWVNGTITQAAISQTGAGTPIVFSLSGDSMVSETNVSGVAQRTLLTNFSFANTIDPSLFEISLDNDFTVASGLIGGSVTVTTVIPFKISLFDSYPYAGQLTVTGVNGASVKLTVVDNTSVTLEYDFDGNGVYGDGTDPLMKTVAWSAL